MTQSKHLILFFIPKLCFTIFFQYFSDGVDSRPGRFLWHQYGSKWTLYYTAADKIPSRRTLPQNQFFWNSGNAGKILAGTWCKGNSTFGGQIWEDRKCGRCSQRPRSFIVWHNSWEYSQFMGRPWGFLQIINPPSFTRVKGKPPRMFSLAFNLPKTTSNSSKFCRKKYVQTKWIFWALKIRRKK